MKKNIENMLNVQKYVRYPKIFKQIKQISIQDYLIIEKYQ